MAEAVVVALSLAIALWLKPWRQKGIAALATPMLATLVILPWLWALPMLHHSTLSLQWSGACLVLLMLGWPLAVFVLCAVAAIAALLGGAGLTDGADMAVWLGIVPATLAMLA